MREVNKEVIMPGGWTYVQTMPDGTLIDIKTGSYDELAPAVLNFRLQNRLPIGQPEIEVPDQICTKWPRQCPSGIDVGYTPAAPRAPGPIRFIDEIIMWAQGLLGNPNIRDLEIKEEAERRGQICRQCPLNVEWEHSCPTCVSHANQVLAMIRKGREIDRRGVKACQLLKQENGTAVWLKKEILRRGPVEQLPSNCWVK